MVVSKLQYISDEEGNTTSVIVPIDLWREIASERETAYLLGRYGLGGQTSSRSG